MSFDQLWAECERLQARVDSLREENARLTRERDEAVIHLGQYGRDVVKENAALRAEGVSTRTELIRLQDKVEMLLNQNREIAASNADHVRWHREKEAEIERLKVALRGKCDEYKMHDPGWCAFCDAARAALRGGGK